ncbi:hypothetical protein BXZ70DRAFT_919785 [Cristinia sonorae]|uniref:Uncharacterized protein n=1 Tax=Cristinia sonorae TaxID=1940300 RepID=A0A8K0UXD9_9AGAR|nr:hypothetical protein BXZ70DRAFT_919785 [Cristinia sonorae]
MSPHDCTWCSMLSVVLTLPYHLHDLFFPPRVCLPHHLPPPLRTPSECFALNDDPHVPIFLHSSLMTKTMCKFFPGFSYSRFYLGARNLELPWSGDLNPDEIW